MLFEEPMKLQFKRPEINVFKNSTQHHDVLIEEQLLKEMYTFKKI